MRIFHDPDQCRLALGPSVATIGKYDGMHLGHQRILDKVKALASEAALPALAILSEPQPEEFFNAASAPARLTPFADKVAFLDSYGIDAVLCMTFDTALSQMSAEHFARDYLGARLGLRALVVGDDFRFGRQRLGDLAMLVREGEAQGYSVHAVTGCMQGGVRVSSTLIRDSLRRGDCARACELLGRPYSITGEVVAGRRLGRELGMPTANIALRGNGLPLCGIFVVLARVDGHAFPGVASIGYKPTVSVEPEPSLEVHLMDFSGDLYGRIMHVDFLHKLRDEMKFSGLPELKAAMEADLRAARAHFEHVVPGTAQAGGGRES